MDQILSDTTSFFNADDRRALPPYAGLRLLSESATGHCRIFECVRFGRHVAVKCLKPEFSAVPLHRTLLHKEYQLAVSLYHPSLVSVLTFEEVPGAGEGIVMEFVEGMTLDAYIAGGNCTRRRAQAIFGHLCDALAYIHSRGVVHRDIKPANILVTPNPLDPDSPGVRVIDFGLSSAAAFSGLAIPAGTRSFSAPEQFEADAEVTHRADIYSLGRVMQAMLPRRHWLWHRLAARCAIADPARRPDRADRLPAMLRRSRIAARCVAAVMTAVALLWLALPALRHSDRPAVAGGADSAVADRIVAETAPLTGDTAVMLPSGPGAHKTTDPTSEGVLPWEPDLVVPENTSDSVTLEMRVAQYSRRAAEKWFAWEIHALDTLETAGTYSLLYVGHWQWQARQQVRRWLEAQIGRHSPYVGELMKIASGTISEYARIPENEQKRYDAQARAVKRYMKDHNGTVIGATTAETYYRDGYIITYTLQPDGSWKCDSTIDENRRGRDWRLRSQ